LDSTPTVFARSGSEHEKSSSSQAVPAYCKQNLAPASLKGEYEEGAVLDEDGDVAPIKPQSTQSVQTKPQTEAQRAQIIRTAQQLFGSNEQQPRIGEKRPRTEEDNSNDTDKRQKFQEQSQPQQHALSYRDYPPPPGVPNRPYIAAGSPFPPVGYRYQTGAERHPWGNQQQGVVAIPGQQGGQQLGAPRPIHEPRSTSIIDRLHPEQQRAILREPLLQAFHPHTYPHQQPRPRAPSLNPNQRPNQGIQQRPSSAHPPAAPPG
ncbi:MAG: hypothetical protein Q9196_007485, partial [Gyalolechia fulgens]